MQSICWTTTRLIRSAIRFSTLAEAHSKSRPHLVSVVCGFPKDLLRTKYKLGKFGDDSWFMAQNDEADVIGNYPIPLGGNVNLSLCS